MLRLPEIIQVDIYNALYTEITCVLLCHTAPADIARQGTETLLRSGGSATV